MAAKKTPRSKAPRARQAKLDARPDRLDLRDLPYRPRLRSLPPHFPDDKSVRDYLSSYVRADLILNQGTEGACTGFGLATVVHTLLRTRSHVPDRVAVSPRMLYNMARRYDEWPGEDYSGSSARGAMKGWHKHGVCSRGHWVYDRTKEKHDPALFARRYEDALARPLGAYFRVNHKDIVAMHAAIAEAVVLFATAQVHEGWDDVGPDGRIEWAPGARIDGGHAFAIVGYDRQGFWIQNSWADDWGKGGFAQISYDDWLANGSDIWVARLGAPIELRARTSVSQGIGVAAQGSRGYMFCDLRPHIISLGNDGALRPGGTFGTDASDVGEIFETVREHLPKRPRLLLYAHGGLVPEDSAVQKVADLRTSLLDAGVYPISLIWKSDFWTTLRNMLEDSVSRRRPEGFLDASKDFMLDRLDDALEPIARVIGGRAQWREMKENALLAGAAAGGLRVVVDRLVELGAAHPSLEIHLVGHSAGSILLGALVDRLREADLPVATCTLWAPACTIAFYREHYVPAMKDGTIRRFALFTLTEKAERDDHCANIYHKSLLYLVSNAFEDPFHKPEMDGGLRLRGSEGIPLLGMEAFVRQLKAAEKPDDWVLSPNLQTLGDIDAAGATTHGSFDDDAAVLKATLARMLGKRSAPQAAVVARNRSQSVHRERRAALMRQTTAAPGP